MAFQRAARQQRSSTDAQLFVPRVDPVAARALDSSGPTAGAGMALARMWRRGPQLREHPGVADVDELLQDIRTALDPARFFAALGETEEGQGFLRGQSDTVPLSRGFLDAEAAIARRGLEALEAIARFLSDR